MRTLAFADTVPTAALIPFAVAAVGFVAYCLFDLSRSSVRYLPKWLWAIVCLVSIPFGGVVYLLIGRDHR
ncbi:PLDc N-terminal domain-containing protein [Dactylosporangium sp. NPDC051485]|uniref:PLDc N-terminal domain-containing protein n=1 Tax=Dactylosporangium sp. NPDC051485 TaxID=3154846 RepID=UPI003436EE3E